MIGAGSVRRLTPFDARDMAAVLGAPALALLGYAAISDLRVAAALIAALGALAWGAIAFHRPRVAVAAAFPLLLVAGTKFRTRDATASLEGVLDAQIVMELALFGIIGIGLLAVWLAHRAVIRPTRGEIVVAGYAALALLSTLWSAAPALTFARAVQLALVAALAAAAVRILGPSRAIWGATRALAAYVLLCAALAATVPWASGTHEYSGGFRLAWFAVHPVQAGTLAAIAAIALLSIALFERSSSTPSKLGVRAPVIALALVAVLVLAAARGPMLAFAVAAALLCLLRVRPSFRVAALMVVPALVLATIVFAADLRAWLDTLANQNSVVTRTFFRGQTADAVLGLNGRLELWQEVRPAMVGHLMSGHGYQGSRAVLLDTASWAGYAHNAFLQTVLDLGLMGAIILVALIAIGLAGSRQQTLVPWARATVVTLMVFLVVNSMSTESFAGPPSIETLLLFLCVLCAGRGGRP